MEWYMWLLLGLGVSFVGAVYSWFRGRSSDHDGPDDIYPMY